MKLDMSTNYISYVKSTIFVTFDRIGFHRYPEAATSGDLKDVSYLGNRHRHKFFFKVTVPVEHNNRYIEFHQFLNKCLSYYDSKELDVDFKSCEMMAEDLIRKIKKDYHMLPWIKVMVSEDNECGATIKETFRK